MKIAVFMDEDGNVLPFSESGVVELYSDHGGNWQCVNQVPFSLKRAMKLSDIHREVAMLISEVEDCEILIVDDIKGIVRAILEEYKIGIWQFKGILHIPLLNKVKEELTRVKKDQKKEIIAPVLTGNEADALYKIDLAATLEANKGLNSMNILIPFMQTTNFRKLSITCNHTPRWLDMATNMMELKYDIQEEGSDQMCIIVEPVDFEAGVSLRKRVRFNLEGGGCSSGGCSSGGF
jgi:Fe-only nitrogenase accessory protein AnfO